MIAAFKTALSKYATLQGRASRPEYWWWVLALVILFAILRLVDGALVAPLLGFEAFSEDAGQPISMLVSLGLLLPAISVSVRRLHDVDKSGWWLLLAFVPVIGALILLYFYVQRSDDDANQFGAPEPFR